MNSTLNRVSVYWDVLDYYFFHPVLFCRFQPVLYLFLIIQAASWCRYTTWCWSNWWIRSSSSSWFSFLKPGGQVTIPPSPTPRYTTWCWSNWWIRSSYIVPGLAFLARNNRWNLWNWKTSFILKLCGLAQVVLPVYDPNRPLPWGSHLII